MLDKTLLDEAEQQQETLCRRAGFISAPTEADAFQETDLQNVPQNRRLSARAQGLRFVRGKKCKS